MLFEHLVCMRAGLNSQICLLNAPILKLSGAVATSVVIRLCRTPFSTPRRCMQRHIRALKNPKPRRDDVASRIVKAQSTSLSLPFAPTLPLPRDPQTLGGILAFPKENPGHATKNQARW
jgi:hypothetical protein